MANQTELLNVSDEMKLDDERQSFEGLECGEGLCSSSSDTTEELYSSSVPDTGCSSTSMTPMPPCAVRCRSCRALPEWI